MVSWSEKLAFRRDKISFYCNALLYLADINMTSAVFCYVPSTNDDNNRNRKMTEPTATTSLYQLGSCARIDLWV